MSKRLVVVALVVVMALALLPTGAALADGLPTDPIITFDQCVITVEFDAQVPGQYIVNIWDAGYIVQSQSASGDFFGDTLVFEFLYVEYVEGSAPGIWIEVVKDGSVLFGSQQWSVEQICKGSLTGCEPSLTSGAVVGEIKENTSAYWGPSLDAETDTVLEIGKTWWVLGTDESGSWYQLLVSCEPVWVPASVMGPNFDEVWNGHPLPTDVVE